jgi:hypothetical protein
VPPCASTIVWRAQTGPAPGDVNQPEAPEARCPPRRIKPNLALIRGIGNLSTK